MLKQLLACHFTQRCSMSVTDKLLNRFFAKTEKSMVSSRNDRDFREVR